MQPPSPQAGHAPPRPDTLVVAVDGPSGSGKSSVCRAVAARLGIRYLDTGATYRAVTWAALARGLDLTARDDVAALARGLALDVTTDPAAPTVAVDGVDVTRAIRESRISEAVSAVATNLAVREELVRRQRELIGAGGIVAEGRDITTVVAPDAPVRILLTADPEARLARRARELHGHDDEAALHATRDQVLRRDRDDATVAAFLTASDGVVTVDTSALTLDEVIETVLVVIRDRTGIAEPHPARRASS